MQKSRILNDKFFRDNPLNDEITYPDMLITKYFSVSVQELAEEIDKTSLPFFSDERLKKIDQETDLIENTATAEELIRLMRKNLDIVSHKAIYQKALAMQDDFMPLAIERYMRSRQDTFLELCACVFIDAETKYLNRLYESYHDIKSPYAQALLCVVFGMNDMTETTQLLLDEYHRFQKYYPDEDYYCCPLHSLHLFR